MKHLHRIKKFEERLEKVIEDPAKIIQIIKRIIYMGTTDIDGTPNVTGSVPEEEKVTYYEFVKYFGNYQVERAEENRWDIEEAKRFAIEMEERIKELDGFSSYDLPKEMVLKFK